MMRVGFAGLGRMGAPMASNLARAGFELVLWNRTTETAVQLADATGGEVRATPRELAESCDVVITMLADDGASEHVHDGEDGLLGANVGADHLIEMGTLSPGHVRQLADRAGGRVVIDAPVSGSIDAAQDARLMIMAGADEATIEAVKPILAAMGSEIVCLGSVGAGATMKLAVNMLIHGLNQTLAESLTLAEAAGIPASEAYRVIEGSSAAAPMLHYRKRQYLDEVNSPVSFALSLARKDVALATELAGELDVAVPQTQLNLDQLRAAEADGFGERDMASIINYLRGIT
jgi:3-hydroxyisobutyrate dehydrogenase-like beta-hydroxyacid dehydrogenase